MGLHIGKKAKNFAKHPGRTTKKCVSKGCNKLGKVCKSVAKNVFAPAMFLGNILNKSPLFNMNRFGLNRAYPQFLPNQPFITNFNCGQVNTPSIFAAQPTFLRNMQLNNFNRFI